MSHVIVTKDTPLAEIRTFIGQPFEEQMNYSRWCARGTLLSALRCGEDILLKTANLNIILFSHWQARFPLAETLTQKVERLGRELEDARNALASDGLPDGWKWGEERYGAPQALSGGDCYSPGSISWELSDRGSRDSNVYIPTDSDDLTIPARVILAWAKRAEEWLTSQEG
jgi:hypothetical protein